MQIPSLGARHWDRRQAERRKLGVPGPVASRPSLVGRPPALTRMFVLLGVRLVDCVDSGVNDNLSLKQVGL